MLEFIEANSCDYAKETIEARLLEVLGAVIRGDLDDEIAVQEPGGVV